jgi:histidinol-phosphatase (PHP family)
MIPHDYHVHSNFSADGKASMETMCRRALELGLPEIGFAEHYDLHPEENPRDWLRIAPWMEELECCRRKFGGQLRIRAGIEVGEPHLFRAELEAKLEEAPFDFVTGSLHWIGRRLVFDIRYFERPPEEAFGLYFLELERMTRAGGFDILGHLDVVVRTGFEAYGSYDPKIYEDLIRPVLGNCIERNIALEVNTSGMRRSAGILIPGREILGWYREMGGSLVTLGSDAHRPEHLALHLNVAVEALREAGFQHVIQFERRQPRRQRLE